MESRHTPGPWTHSHPDRIVDKDGRTILVIVFREGIDRAGGNIDLIAAAPTLLEACIQARAALPDLAFANEKNGEKNVVRLLNHALSLVGE